MSASMKSIHKKFHHLTPDQDCPWCTIAPLPELPAKGAPAPTPAPVAEPAPTPAPVAEPAPTPAWTEKDSKAFRAAVLALRRKHPGPWPHWQRLIDSAMNAQPAPEPMLEALSAAVGAKDGLATLREALARV